MSKLHDLLREAAKHANTLAAASGEHCDHEDEEDCRRDLAKTLSMALDEIVADAP